MSIDVDQVLQHLTGFQRDAVDHVVERFYRSDSPTNRFLVADETGLGKSIVARGVVAEAIHVLQDDPTVNRIDIVYVCSNADLARQNLVRLNVTGAKNIAFTSRLSLLALETGRLTGTPAGGRKRVNLISFTPGTSFDMNGWRTGSKEERALIHALLKPVRAMGSSDPAGLHALEVASLRIFQRGVTSLERFEALVGDVERRLEVARDETIAAAFVQRVLSTTVAKDYIKLMNLVLEEGPSDEIDATGRHLTGVLRIELSKASVAALEPDLVILDEFQRFRHLLDPDSGEAAEIAHHLFEYDAAKVLLLSATPYKPFTRAAEAEDDHFADLEATLRFLAGGAEKVAPLLQCFADYRTAVLSGGDAAAQAERLRAALLQVMSRTERPRGGAASETSREVFVEPMLPSSEDVRGYVALQRLAALIDVPIPLEYWKSIPYFGSFLDGYAVETRLDRALADPDRADSVRAALAALPAVEASRVRTYRPLADGETTPTGSLSSAPLRALAASTVEAGLWRLLWMPASMPYLAPRGVFRSLDPAAATKRVIFSAWSATPTAIATTLSYEADRRSVAGSRLEHSNTPEARRSVRTRLAWAMDGGRAAGMSTLALFWPHPVLAEAADPLLDARADGRCAPPARAERRVLDLLDCGDVGERDQAWESYFRRPDGIRSEYQTNALARGFGGEQDTDEDAVGGIQSHVRVAVDIEGEAGETRHEDVALLALHGPGNTAWRALSRLRSDDDTVTALGQWQAAAALANGLRSLFGRVETMLLLDQLYEGDDDGVYWRKVLRYCADGNLQAVLDEYAFQLHGERGGGPMSDAALADIANRMVAAITLRPATYSVRDTKSDQKFSMSTRFAVRYGGSTQESEAVRQPEVRNAFNSPFQPFVLASTSVGQEGIDFHWWSHSVLHWNLPPNPVDFEQREGRVDRYGGHAVRKNVAAQHAEVALSSNDRNPWRAAFAAAADAYPELGEFAPHWVHPGPHAIERHVALYPLSRDHDRYRQLKRDMSFYRLTLGQPRQEDMLELMEKRGIDPSRVAALDLRPPRAKSRVRTRSSTLDGPLALISTPPSAPAGSITPAELARELGVSDKQIRRFLRTRVQDHAHGQSWHLNRHTADEVREYFA